MKNNRRKLYLVNKPFQFKLLLLLSLMVTGIILVSHGLSLGFSEIFISKSYAAAGQVLPSQFSLSHFLEVLWIPILTTVIFILIFVLIFGLVYSHRIAGPLFNLKNVMARVSYGDLSTPMRIRHNDELHDIEDAFNQMQDGLNKKLFLIKEACNKLPDKDKRYIDQVINQEFKLHASDD